MKAMTKILTLLLAFLMVMTVISPLTACDKTPEQTPDTTACDTDPVTEAPTETEAETEETLAMLRALPMTYAHVFPYSERPGTRAASLPQLPKKVRQEHAARVRNLIAEKKAAFLEVQMGLPEMWAAFDSADARHGNNEFFVDCRMEQGFGPFPGHELIKVEPLRIEKNMLIVRPAR